MKTVIVPIIMFILVLFSEVNAYRASRVIFGKYSMKKVTLIYWSIFLFSMFIFIWARSWDNYARNLAVNIIMIFITMKLFAALVILVGDILQIIRSVYEKKGEISIEKQQSRRAFIGKSALAVSGLPFLAMTHGIFKTAFQFKLHREVFRFTNFPAAFNGLKIIQISDIHTGSLVNKAQLNNAIDLILGEHPDLIVFTGDLVNNRTDEAYPYKEVLKRLKAPMGVYSVLGNHDYGDYETWENEADKQANFKEMLDLHEELGWKLMMNESQVFEKDGEKWALVGVENWGANLHFPRHGKLHDAMRGTEESAFKILLSHDPSHWDAEVNNKKTDIDLTLSGHTHGFQFGVEIPGFKWSPSQYVYKQWAGLYYSGKQILNVNRGLGCIGYMGRIGIKPEISVMEFRNS